jgi:hypothetical protein
VYSSQSVGQNSFSLVIPITGYYDFDYTLIWGTNGPSSITIKEDGVTKYSDENVLYETERNGSASLFLTAGRSLTVFPYYGDNDGYANCSIEKYMANFNRLYLSTPSGVYTEFVKDGRLYENIFNVDGVDNNDIEITYLTDTFRWTDNGGSSWTSGGDVNTESTFSLTGYGIEIIFTQKDGHGLGDSWDFTQGDMKGMSVRDSSGSEYFSLTNGALFATSLVGMVSAFALSSPPNGWLECNGAAISRTAYSELFNAIGTTFGAGNGSTTFNIPDLRGEFIRGWDHGVGRDPGRTFGSYQADEIRSHRHSKTGGYFGNFNAYHYGHEWRGYYDDVTLYTDYTGGPETRPRNRALLFCIKF